MKMALVRLALSLFAFYLLYGVVTYANRRDDEDKKKNDMERRAGRPWNVEPTFIKRHWWQCAIVAVLCTLALVAVPASVIGVILALPIG